MMIQSCKVCVHCANPYLDNGGLVCERCDQRLADQRQGMAVVVIGILCCGAGFTIGCLAACFVHFFH